MKLNSVLINDALPTRLIKSPGKKRHRYSSSSDICDECIACYVLESYCTRFDKKLTHTKDSFRRTQECQDMFPKGVTWESRERKRSDK